jgi:exonuclease SbcC
VIVEKIRLRPFGGVSDASLTFSEGLNVVLGPNEAGKTTVFNAAQNAIFTPAGLTASQLRSKIGRFFPAAGGDTVCVEISFRHPSGRFHLRRTWGPLGGSELTLPDGGVVTEETEIAARLFSLLGASEGTFKSVLMTYQTGLGRTLEELKRDYKATVHSLGDILRRSILQTDGVSIDRFRALIEERYEEYAGRWDFRTKAPENQKRYKKKAGLIHDTYWDMEDIRKEYENAKNLEGELDRANNELAVLTEEIKQKEEHVKQYRDIVDAARKRLNLQKDLLLLEKEKESLKEANTAWPVLQKSIGEKKETTASLRTALEAFEKENEDAVAFERGMKLRERLERATKRKTTLTEAQQNLSAVKKIIKEELEEIRKAVENVAALEAGLKAGKLSLSVTAEKPLTLELQTDSDQKVSRDLEKEERISIEAGARIILSTRELRMEILSGEGDIDGTLSRIEEAKKTVQTLLSNHGVSDFEEAKEASRVYEETNAEVRAAEKSLEEELDGRSYDSLEKEAKKRGGPEKIRPLTNIVTDIANTKNRIEEIESSKNEAEKRLDALEKQYGSHDALIETLSDVTVNIREKEKTIQSLPEPSDTVGDAEELVAGFEATERALDTTRKTQLSLIKKVYELQGRAPALSSEEYARQLADSEEVFNDALKRGEAVARIRDAAENIVRDIDTDTYGGIMRKLSGYASAITSGKYETVPMEEGLPEGFVTQGGVFLPHDLLSAGTRDTLALALRLSMAEYFLEESDGFLFMDDPLVNLDPERQKNAAEILARFAEKRQIVLFSCHPSNADLLGGTLVRL